MPPRGVPTLVARCFVDFGLFAGGGVGEGFAADVGHGGVVGVAGVFARVVADPEGFGVGAELEWKRAFVMVFSSPVFDLWADAALWCGAGACTRFARRGWHGGAAGAFSEAHGDAAAADPA